MHQTTSDEEDSKDVDYRPTMESYGKQGDLSKPIQDLYIKKINSLEDRLKGLERSNRELQDCNADLKERNRELQEQIDLATAMKDSLMHVTPLKPEPEPC